MPPPPRWVPFAVALALAACGEAPLPPSTPVAARTSTRPAASAPPPPPFVPPPPSPIVEGPPELVPQRGLHRFPSRLVVSRDGRLVALGAEGQDIALFDPKTAELRAVLQGHAAELYSVDFAPSGDAAASSARDGTIRIWDLRTGKQRKVIETRGGRRGLRPPTADPEE